MSLIQIPNIEPCTCEFWFENILIGIIKNEYQLNDVRIQVKQKQLQGYYFMFKNHKIDIQLDGDLSEWPDEFFDITNKQYKELYGY